MNVSFLLVCRIAGYRNHQNHRIKMKLRRKGPAETRYLQSGLVWLPLTGAQTIEPPQISIRGEFLESVVRSVLCLFLPPASNSSSRCSCSSPVLLSFPLRILLCSYPLLYSLSCSCCHSPSARHCYGFTTIPSYSTEHRLPQKPCRF